MSGALFGIDRSTAFLAATVNSEKMTVKEVENALRRCEEDRQRRLDRILAGEEPVVYVGPNTWLETLLRWPLRRFARGER